MNNKKTFLFIMTLMVLVIGLSAASATQVADDAASNDNTMIQEQAQMSKVADTTKTTDATNKNTKTITKNNEKNKITKTEATHVINDTNFESYFNNNGELNNTVQAGDILDFQGSISKNQSMNFRIPLTLTSTTGDALINLNTTSSGDTGENPGNAFSLFNSASNSNISHINFENTQIFVKNASNVVINNITTYNHDQQVGAGVGTVAVREFSENIVIENSTFKTHNNTGRSTVVFTAVKNSIFRNNTIIGIGNVGNLFYLNVYNLDGVSTDDTTVNVNNTVENNIINGSQAWEQSICYAIVVCGSDNKIINNTIDHSGIGITTASVTGDKSLSVRTQIINNTVPHNSVQTPDDGVVKGNKIGTLIYHTANSEISDNEVMDVIVEAKNVHIDNMNIQGELTLAQDTTGLVISNSTLNEILLSGTSGNIKDNISLLNNNISSLQIGTGRFGYVTNLIIQDNRISDELTITGRSLKSINVENNTIKTGKEHAINCDAGITDSKIDGNVLIARNTYGNDAINVDEYTADGISVGTNYPIINISGDLTLNEESNINFTVNSPTEMPGTLLVDVNDAPEIRVTLTQGKGSLKYTPTTDEVNVKASYYVDNTLISKSAVLPVIDPGITYTKLTTTPSKTSVNVQEQLNITTKLTDTTGKAIPSQNLTITVDGKTFNGTTNNNGEYTFEFTASTVGLNIINATFTKTNNYAASNASNNFTVTKKETKLTTTPSKTTINAGEQLNITTKLTDTTGKAIPSQNLTVTVNGQTFKGTTNNNGEYTFPYTTQTSGQNNITATFTETQTLKPSNATNKFTVTKKETKLNGSVVGNKVGNTTVSAVLTDSTGKPVANAPIVISLSNSTVNATTNDKGEVKVPVDLRTGSNNVTVSFAGNDSLVASSATFTSNVSKNGVNIKLNPVKGVIGEEITLTAYLTDEANQNVTGGNLAFKLNGKTLREDGRFDSKAPAMKFNIKDGFVTFTIKADLYLRNAKNLTASYSGTYKYDEITSDSVEAQIQKRYASLIVSVAPSKAKQYETIVLTAAAKDVTKNGKNNTLINQDTKVMFKVNGVTLKDNKGKTLYVPIGKDNKAVYNYTIPAGTGGITNSKAVRNYSVDAIFVGDNYYPGARNASKFNVERSNTTVNISSVKVTSGNVLSVKATLTDYKGNNLIGTNKVTVKINGKSYIDPKNNKPKYWSVKDGVVNLTGIAVDAKTTIKRVMVVTGERQAYLEGRNETTTITRV